MPTLTYTMSMTSDENPQHTAAWGSKTVAQTTGKQYRASLSVNDSGFTTLSWSGVITTAKRMTVYVQSSSAGGHCRLAVNDGGGDEYFGRVYAGGPPATFDLEPSGYTYKLRCNSGSVEVDVVVDSE